MWNRGASQVANICAKMARNPALPEHLQARLARDKKMEVRQTLASRRDILPDTLDMLIRPGEHDSVLKMVAMNRRTTEAMQNRLSKIGSEEVQHFVSQRKMRQQMNSALMEMAKASSNNHVGLCTYFVVRLCLMQCRRHFSILQRSLREGRQKDNRKVTKRHALLFVR